MQPPELRRFFKAPLVQLNRPAPILLSWNSFTQVPRRRHTVARPLPVSLSKEFDLRQPAAKQVTRSVLVVLPHLDGLLRIDSPRCVATWCQPGFAVFPHSLRPVPSANRSTGTGKCFPTTRAPLEEPSSSTAVPHHCGPCLPAAISRDPALTPAPPKRRDVRSGRDRCMSPWTVASDFPELLRCGDALTRPIDIRRCRSTAPCASVARTEVRTPSTQTQPEDRSLRTLRADPLQGLAPSMIPVPHLPVARLQ